MDQLANMRTFVRVVDLKSFTRAADALGLSRSVVSGHIADLERYLGTQLVQRTTRRVGVTADGAEYREHCRRILADLEAADEAMKGGRLRPQGRLRVDVPEAFGRYLLIPALPKFTARYPDLQLEVQLNDRVVDLIAEQIDAAVRVGTVKSPHLVARRIVRTRLITCATPEYLQKYGIPAEPRDLRNHKLIGYLSASGRRPQKWIFQRGTDRRQLAFKFNVSFNSADARTLAAVRGAGVVQTMDLLVAESLANGRLQAVLKDWSAEGAPISVVFPATLRESPKVRAFSEFAFDVLQDYRRHVDLILAAEPRPRPRTAAG